MIIKEFSKFIIVLNIVFIGIPCVMYAQYNTDIGKVTISSPNAASLGKYGDIPISYHTGIPNINIPIFTIKTGTLALPISVSYHASGLKVQEQASWIGAGWSLNAGGVITRTVIGAPDDKGLNSANTDKGHFSDYGYNSYLFSEGPSSCDPDPNGNGPAYCPQGTNYAPQDSYIRAGKFDGEPDLYFFNFNGHSGKFYFNDDRTPVLLPEQDLKITPIYPGTDWRGIIGFIITTDEGVQYYFGQNQNNDGNIDALEITYNISTQNHFTGQGATSAWYLNKIVSADGQFVITLMYQPENYSYYSLSMFPVPSIPDPNLMAYKLEYDLDKNFINGVRLSKISFANGEIDFNTGSLRQDLSLGTDYTGIDDVANTNGILGGRTLGNISIRSTDLCKKYSFYTSYFYDGSPLTGDLFTKTYTSLNLTSDKYRLRLDSIKETSCDNTKQISPYKFNYFSERVPRKLSFGIDHWGFNNGVTNNGLIPTYTIVSGGTPTTYSGAIRDAVWPDMRGGSLQQIVYPTGGTSTFDYEPNGVYFSSSNYKNNYLTGLVVHQYGQSQITHTVPFTIVGSGDCNFSVTNNSTNWSPTFSIKNSSNVEQGLGPWLISVSSTFNKTLSLPPGSYQATLSFPSNSEPNLINGASATLRQWQTVSTQENRTVGGLRIKTITNDDGIANSNPVVSSYGYNYNNVLNGHSSGILFSRPVYVQALRNDVWAIVNGASCSSIGCFNCFGSDAAYYKSPSSIRPMASTQGNHIGYGEVYVSQTGNGYSVYKYYGSNGVLPHIWDTPVEDVCVRTLNTFCDPNIPNSPAPPEPFDPMRGELANQAIYSQGGQLLKSSAYFPVYQFDSLITPGIISRFYVTGYQLTGSSVTAPTAFDVLKMMPGQLSPVGIYTFTEYTLQSAKKIKDSIETITYDPVSGNYLTDINATYYSSKYHCAPTKIISVSSKKENMLTNIKSAFDFRITNYNEPDQLSTYYTNINNDRSYLTSAIGALTTSPTDPHYYWQRLNIYTNFRYMKAVHRQSFIAYRRQNFTDPDNAFKTAHDNAKSGADAALKPILELQDEGINPPIEVTSWKNTNLTAATFTKYDYSTDPATSVYPKTIQKIKLAAPSAFYVSSGNSGTAITKDSRYTDESSIKFYKGNLVELLPKTGIYTSYIWGNNNTSPIVKAIGVDQNTLQTAYDAVAGNLSLLRNKSALSNAQLFTYTYSPLVGMTSQTDPSGRTTYYEYDALGRLRLIRDQDNNILKKICYNYAGQPENCQ